MGGGEGSGGGGGWGDEGGSGDRGWGDFSPQQSHHLVATCAANSARNPGKHTKEGIICIVIVIIVYWPR
jgi:hypothetical protein